MSTRLWLKMGAVGALMCIGGPALVIYVTPTEEELFKRYNPELQRRSLENRQGKQEDFDQFVNKLKQFSKSDKPIWEVAAEDERQRRHNAMSDQQRLADDVRNRQDEIQRRRDEIKRHATTS